jgi:hypothetical protein
MSRKSLELCRCHKYSKTRGSVTDLTVPSIVPALFLPFIALHRKHLFAYATSSD